MYLFEYNAHFYNITIFVKLVRNWEFLINDKLNNSRNTMNTQSSCSISKDFLDVHRTIPLCSNNDDDINFISKLQV